MTIDEDSIGHLFTILFLKLMFRLFASMGFYEGEPILLVFMRLSDVLWWMFYKTIWEVLLLVEFGRGRSPLRLAFAYFLTAAIFEFPTVFLEGITSGDVGVLIFLPIVPLWYLSTLIGLAITVKALQRTKSPSTYKS